MELMKPFADGEQMEELSRAKPFPSRDGLRGLGVRIAASKRERLA